MATQPICATKVCSKCGVEKPNDAEHFRWGKKSPKSDCRECWKRYCKEYYAANREKMLERFRSARAADPEFHRERDRRYFNEHRETKRQGKKRQWAKTDPAIAKAKLDDWRAANPDKVRAADLRRLDRVRNDAELRAKATDRVRRWRQANPIMEAARRDRRRALEVGASGQWTREDIRGILKAQGRFCFYCHCRLTKFQCDHFIPLARGGSNGPENIVLSCGPCNFSKGAKMPWEWQPERFAPDFRPRS
jgi:hypothetical protein